MKMPSRPFVPSGPSPDIFGLYDLSLLERACESEADRKKRFKAVEEGVAAAFRAAVRHLGDEEARQLFKRVTRRKKRGQGKIFQSDRDARLLSEYKVASQKGETIAALARRLHATSTEFGNTADAVETQIRKLVKEQKKRDRVAAFEARRLRMAMHGEIPTLLSDTQRKK